MARPTVLFALPILVAAVVAVATPPALAAPETQATATWSMVPMSKDADGDGFIDGDGGVPRRNALSSEPARKFVGAGNRIAQPSERLINGNQSWYLHPDGYPVALNACKSRGNEYRFIVRADGDVVRTTKWKKLDGRKCTQEVFLPEGPHEVELTVRGSGRTATSTMAINVVNYLTIVMGDSYASGEGNPRNVQAWLGSSGSFTPYWDSDACHRSVHGGPAQAALRLENASDTSSVTLIDVACSGATINAGILGPQTAAGQTASQIEQVRSIIADRPVDLAMVMIGGNDVGFTSLLASCAIKTDCPLDKALLPPLSRYRTVQDGVQSLTGQLTSGYARIAQCLGGTACLVDGNVPSPGLTMSPSAAVLPIMYPDITRGTDGQPCTYLTLSQSDFGWARDTILVPNPAPSYAYRTSQGPVVPLPLPQGTLNGQIGATAPLLGWRPVVRAWSVSGDSDEGHGVCAANPWVFGLTALSAMPDASFHPNPDGHLAMGKAIAGALELAVD